MTGKEKEQGKKQETSTPVSVPDTKPDAKDAQIQDLTNTIKHVQADYENYRKRIERDAKDWKKYAAKDLVIKLLPVLDSFELALLHMDSRNVDKKNEMNDEHMKGMELIYSQLRSVLEAEGLRAFDCVGKRFDPMLHEALISQEHDGDEGIVLEELQKGFVFHDHVIRPAKVKISKKREEKKEVV